MKHLHVCIVTGQPQANLIPILHEKPDYVVLSHSDDKKEDADAFAQTLVAKARYASEQLFVKAGLPTHPYDAIAYYAMALFDELRKKYPGCQITWNATGGTKQMALAFWDVLDRDSDRAIYTDTLSGELEVLRSGACKNAANASERVALQSVLDPDIYLHAVGKIRRKAVSDDEAWRKRAMERRPATCYLGDHAQELDGLIQQFNRQLENNDNSGQTLKLERVGRQWERALELLERTGVLDCDGQGRYYAKQRDSAAYLTGGWLEEYVWHAVKEQVDYVDIGLKYDDIKYRRKGQSNEIDAFIVHRNRLLLVECKSGWMGKDEVKDANIIYKLDSIGKNAGGIQATRLLVSAQKLQHDTSKGHYVDAGARASAASIYTLASSEIKALRKHIAQWVENGKWPSN